ncbi:type IV pilus assembly protein PilZ [Bacteriovorax sp. BSW11_IV]|uniref:PilZ domain-containing protein n=1 Tax=Bacteriovorax sp. BSW11_IV TaxID=1353529 RepID=UPI000389F208|nr:PilZ domain-containing protein [Bacteriovorax sp. BSW11_IV]EQC48546.1 type IV pilus assembly protein PilZ [Bacteriovorax sp. BSW11_IV]
MANKVLNFVDKRKENIEKKRRNFERLLFQNFLGAYTVIDANETVYPVELVDISYDGCLFQIPWNFDKDKAFKTDTEIKMRMYFTKHSYIPVVVNIRYGKEYVDTNGQTYMHYGCEFDKTLPSFEAMKNFISFMYAFAEHSTIDKGDARAYFL